jgi:hypothetical protein
MTRPMKNQIETPVGRVMFVRAPKRLTREQVNVAIGGMSDDDPRWLAINQLLDEELASAMLDVSAPSPANRDHAGGQVDALARLKVRDTEARKVPVTPEKPVARKR